ncbi:hypothetical protein JTB14_014794 [Gonioctena quinquepunctata]|nr:hypothetical protein JTB14_014794 [Gonioctena quinquepunctata]
MFFGATKADPPSSVVDPSTKGSQYQPMETTVSVEDELTPAEEVDRQSSAETCHTAEGAPETEALLDPENVTLTEVDQDSLPTGSDGEPGCDRKSWQPQANRGIGGQGYQMAVSSSCSSVPLRLLQANIQHGRAFTALIRQKAQGTRYINISLIQEPWVFQGKIRGMGQAGRSLFYCTSETKNVDANPLPGFCHRDLVAVKIKVVDDTKGNTRDVIVGSAYFPYETVNPPREDGVPVDEFGLPQLNK